MQNVYLVCMNGDALHDELNVAQHFVVHVVTQVHDLEVI